jgi:hypothetical protein
VGAPGAHLDHLPASTVNRFFDDDTVFADLDDELRKAPYAPTPSHGKPKASGPAGRAIALNDMRKLLADRDAALDATTHGEGAHE